MMELNILLISMTRWPYWRDRGEAYRGYRSAPDGSVVSQSGGRGGRAHLYS